MSKVFISKIDQIETDKIRKQAELDSVVSMALEWLELDKIIKRGDRVFIKPNLTLPRYHEGVTTNPFLVEALIKKVNERTNKIYIGESNGGLDCFTADDAFLGHGLDKLSKRYCVELINLSNTSYRKISFHLKNKKVQIEIPTLLIDEIDVFINVPVLKTHAMTSITLGFKNLWGCIPNSRRMLYHHVFHEVIVEIAKIINPKITVIDGTYAMDGNGPIFGDVIETNTLIASDNFGAADLIGCHIMQFDHKNVKYLEIARKKGLIPRFEELTINEDIQKFILHKFKPVMKANNYVAYFAFHSALLTKLIYLSPFSRLKDALLQKIRGDRQDELFKL